MQQIVLDHTRIQSNMSFECPLEPLEFGDFTVNGPDKNCNYTLTMRQSFNNKGYKASSVQVSFTVGVVNIPKSINGSVHWARWRYGSK